MDNNRFEKWITVQAYKHNGLIHREWSPAYLVMENDDFWALASKASLVTESDGRRWMTKEHAIFLLFKNAWMNVISMIKEDGRITYYANVASPTIMDQGILRYIDYDLDLKLFPNEAIKELDELEFERHVLTYCYPEELTKAIRKSFFEIKDLMKHRLPPFEDSKILALYQKFLDENKPFIPRDTTFKKFH